MAIDIKKVAGGPGWYLDLPPLRSRFYVEDIGLKGQEAKEYQKKFDRYVELLNELLKGRETDETIKELRELELDLAGKLGGPFAGAVAEILKSVKKALLEAGEYGSLEVKYLGEQWRRAKSREGDYADWGYPHKEVEKRLVGDLSGIVNMLRYINPKEGDWMQAVKGLIVDWYLRLRDAIEKLDPEEVKREYMEKIDPIMKVLDRSIGTLEDLRDRPPEEVRAYFEKRWAELEEAPRE